MCDDLQIAEGQCFGKFLCGDNPFRQWLFVAISLGCSTKPLNLESKNVGTDVVIYSQPDKKAHQEWIKNNLFLVGLWQGNQVAGLVTKFFAVGNKTFGLGISLAHVLPYLGFAVKLATFAVINLRTGVYPYFP